MYDNRNVFAVILARGGSKGLPRKNVLMIAGKPLIAHSIETAKKTKYIDEVFVSTEDKEIRQISIDYGATVIDRPPHLASDNAQFLDTLKHLISMVPKMNNHDPIIVILFVPAPIRKISDVEKCIEMLDEDVDSVVSLSEIKKHPYRMLIKKDNNFLDFYEKNQTLSTRQKTKPLYANGSICVASCNFLKKQKHLVYGGRIKGLLMDEKHSMDIDTEFDFEICKYLMESDKNNN